jgi:hypothetical protein
MTAPSRKFHVKLSDPIYEAVTVLTERLRVEGGRATSMAEIVREGLHLLLWAADEVGEGSELLVKRGDSPPIPVEVSVLEPLRPEGCQKVVIAAPQEDRRGTWRRTRRSREQADATAGDAAGRRP